MRKIIYTFSWNVATNWSTNQASEDFAPVDDVVIDVAGSLITTTHSTGTTTINSLASEENVILSGGILNLEDASTVNGSFTQTGGTFGGSGIVTLNGSSTWSSGTQSGSGTTNYNGTLSLENTSQKVFGSNAAPGRTFNINGGATVLGTGSLILAQATLNNTAGSTFDFQTDADLFNSGGTTAFNNAGTLLKSGGTDLTRITTPYNNSGTTTVNSGTLEIEGGGTHTGNFNGTGTLAFGGGVHDLSGNVTVSNVVLSGGTVNASGTFDVGDNATTVLSGSTANFTGTISGNALGDLSISSGTGNFSTGNALTANTLTQSGGTLTGSDDVTVLGAATWSSGTQSGSGTTNYNGTLSLESTSQKVFGSNAAPGRTFNINGGATVLGTGSLLLTQATLNNTAGSTFDFQTDADLFNSGGITAFNNAGTLLKSAADLTTGNQTTTISVGVTNTGTVEVQQGVLQFNGSYVQTGGTTLLNGGSLSRPTSQAFDIQGGLVTGFGDITGDMDNGGAIAPGISGIGSLDLVGDYTQVNDGSLDIELGGLSTFDQFNVSGAADFDGTINVSFINGFENAIASGNSFTIATFNSFIDNGVTFNLPTLPTGLSWQPTINANDITLTVQGAGSSTDPVATDNTATTDEDTAISVIDVLANDTDADGDTLSILSFDTSGTTGTVTDNGDGTFSYDPNGQFEFLGVVGAESEVATDSFNYTVSDGNGGTDTATVTVTILGVNDDPVAVDDSASTLAGESVTIDVLSNDSDVDAGDILSITNLSLPSNGAVEEVNGVFVYTPNAGFTGTDSFTYAVSDENDGFDTATVTITVSGPTNTAPVAVDDTFSTDEDTLLSGDVSANDTDNEGDAVAEVLTSVSNGSLTLNADGTFEFDPSGAFDTLAVGDTATETFTYQLSDAEFTSAPATVTLAIEGVNDDPIANPDADSITEDAVPNPISGNVLSNDVDVDNGDVLQVTAVNDTTETVGQEISGQYGSLTLAADGSYTYTLDNSNPAVDALDDGETLTESFTYRVSDGSVEDTTTLEITINGATDTADATFTVTQNLDDGTGNTPGTLSWAIQQANDRAGADVIEFATDVRLNFASDRIRMEPLIESDITIDGNGFTLSGDNNNNGQVDANDRPGLFVRSGNVILRNLTVNGMVARGTNGGGGGAGMGGSLFVYGGNVTVDTVTFNDNRAIGGQASGSFGGGLGFSNAPRGNSGSNGEVLSKRSTTGGEDGGNGGFGAGGGSGGNGGGTSRNFGDSSGSKIAPVPFVGGNGGRGGNGGFGGGGGAGGDGGYGKEGGSGNYAGNGGFGGGAGRPGVNSDGSSKAGAPNGERFLPGGFGGGAGYIGEDGSIGGGGAGMGGAIFIRSGVLTINNSSFTNNSAQGGQGDDNNTAVDDGSGFGGAIFAITEAALQNHNGSPQGLPTEVPTVEISNTQFSNNTADGASNDIFGTPSLDGASSAIVTDANGTPQANVIQTETVASSFALPATESNVRGSGQASFAATLGTTALTASEPTLPDNGVQFQTLTLDAVVGLPLTADEQALITTAFEVPETVDLTTFDPLAAAEAGDPTGVDILAQLIAAQTTIVQTGALLQGALPQEPRSALESVASLALVEFVQNQVEAGQTVDLADESQLQTLLEATVNELLDLEPTFDLQPVTDAIPQLVQVIAASNQIAFDTAATGATPTTIDTLFRIQQVVQDDVASDLQAGVAGEQALSDVVADNTGEALAEQINAGGGTNTAPLAQDDAFTTEVGIALSGNVLLDNGTGADTDADGDSVSVVAVNGDETAIGEPLTLPSGATINLNADGTFTYTPETGFIGDDSFIYTISDSNGGFDTATVSVNVSEVNEPTDPILEIGLYDTDTDQLIQLLNDGDEILASTLEGRSLTIAAFVPNTSPFFSEVESIVLNLNNGDVVNVENIEPYALFGDRNGDFRPGNLPDGDSTITFDIFSRNNGRGDLLGTVSRSFSIIADPTDPTDPTDPANLELEIGLFNSVTDSLIAPLEDGDVIQLNGLSSGELTIAAFVPEESSVFGIVESMRLSLNNGSSQIENIEPYALFGDAAGDFRNGTIPVGTNTITFDLYSQNQLRGEFLGTVTRTFTTVA